MSSLSQHYHNFDLLIQRSGDTYRAEVIDSPAGQASCDFVFPFSDVEMKQIAQFGRRPLANALNTSSYGNDGIEEQSLPLTLVSFGSRLFQAVFAEEIDTCLMLSLNRVEQDNQALRIRLRLDPNAPELAILPWEYLYIPTQNRFAALSQQISLVRYVHLTHPEKSLTQQTLLQVLVILSTPQDLEPLDVEQEWQQLQQATARLQTDRTIVFERLAQPTLQALHQRLQGSALHVLHFIGHSFFDTQEQKGGLVFEDQDKKSHAVSADTLATLLGDHPSLRLVFLNSCKGATSSQNHFFAGSTQTLVQQGIPAVIAMQYDIKEQASTTLAQAFYHGLADGKTVDTALSEARKALYVQDTTSFQWGTPVLFMRTPDGFLWQPEQIAVADNKDNQTRKTIGLSRLLIAIFFTMLLGIGTIGWFLSSLRQPQPPVVTNQPSPQPALTLSPPSTNSITPTEVVPTFPSHPSRAPFLTTTVEIEFVEGCTSEAQLIQEQLTKFWIDRSPPVSISISRSGDTEKSVKPQLRLRCKQSASDIEFQFQLLTKRGAVEAYEPEQLTLTSIDIDQVQRILYALSLYQQRDYQQAATILQSAINYTTDPKNKAWLTLLRGNAYLFAYDYPQAVDAYQYTVELQPDWAAAHHNLGLALMNRDWEKIRLENMMTLPAMIEFSKTLELDADFALSYVALGQMDLFIASLYEAPTLFEHARQNCLQASEDQNAQIYVQGDVCLANVELNQYYLGLSDRRPNYIIRQNDVVPALWAIPQLMRGAQVCYLWLKNTKDPITEQNAKQLLSTALSQKGTNILLEYAAGFADFADYCFSQLKK